jgi:hypothetical protein
MRAHAEQLYHAEQPTAMALCIPAVPFVLLCHEDTVTRPDAPCVVWRPISRLLVRYSSFPAPEQDAQRPCECTVRGMAGGAVW